ncbi:MAG: HD domain-containing protein [Steroidobacteraceae bacterium]
METIPRNASADHAPQAAALSAALAGAHAQFAALAWPTTPADEGAQLAQLVGQIAEDPDIAIAAWLATARTSGLSVNAEAVTARFGANVARLASQLERLGEIGLPPGWSASRGLTAPQAEALRKMLLAVAADPRLIVARLASVLLRLRQARALPEMERQRLALETREIYAPLANRLGLRSLKWELEDLAFRQLEPENYHLIASNLAERRVDRERYIEQVCELLTAELARAGVSAQVYGRPKHIYSIWRKMQAKHLGFDELYDVRAVRIVVADVADCYAALGLVHSLWRILPGEFTDYIATPKDNSYRSIHTAVLGPQDKSLEIQIRTAEMHQYAELGVAAHWRYKEGGGRDANYERKIEWARRVLDPAASTPGESDLIDSVRSNLFSDRIYALTPRGEIVDLPRGATPLDFAYHLHTELGHSCRGAKVDGRIAPLNQPLSNGALVEIIDGRKGGPSRDWLAADGEFLASSRSRAKVRAWFHQQDALVAAKLTTPKNTLEPAAPATPATPTPPPETWPAWTPGAARPATRSRSAVEIEGVGDLPTTMARCCAPVPPEAIAGYLTLGRGVTIHRAHCGSLTRMRALKPERVLKVDWNSGGELLMPVQIRVEAYDRRGLLRDVSDVCALEHLSISAVNSNTDPADRVATIVMRTAVRDVAQLRLVLTRLRAVANVLKAERSG